MYKKFIFSFFILIALLSCGKNNRTPEPSVYTDSRFFPVPTFVDLFASFDNLQRADFDAVLSEYYVSDILKVYPAAYYLGTLTGEAIVAANARNQSKLTSIALCMIEYSRMLGISDEVLQLSDELLSMLQSDNWDGLLESLDVYKSQIELSLYTSRSLDLMTLVQSGGWMQGLHLMTSLLLQDFSEEKTGILDQKGIVDNLVNNLSQMEDESLYDSSWFQELISRYRSIYDIINVSGKDEFSLSEVEKLNELSDFVIENE